MTHLHTLDPYQSASPAVLLLHGLGVNGQSWLPQLEPLSAAGLRPLAVDAPGFGKSPYDGRGWRLPCVAASLAGLLDSLETGPVHVVGLSMGGVIAQQFALDHPQRVRKLVLANTFATLRPPTLNGWIYFITRAVVAHTVGIPTQARLVAQRVFPHSQQEELRRLFIDQVLEADPRAYRAAMRALGFCNLLPRLPQIKAPTLIITGANDTTVPADSQRILSQTIPGARRLVIPDAGHAVSVEQAEKFNSALIQFLLE